LALTLIATLGDDRIQGVHVRSVHQLIATNLRGDVLRAAALVMAVAVVSGLCAGALAGALVRLRDRLARRALRSPGSLVLISLSVVVAGHALPFLHDVALRPQLYEPTLYAHGAVRGALELFATRGLGPGGVIALAALWFAVWLLVPLRPWTELPARLGPALARLSRPQVLACCGITLALLPFWFFDSIPRHVWATSSRPNVLIVGA